MTTLYVPNPSGRQWPLSAASAVLLSGLTTANGANTAASAAIDVTATLERFITIEAVLTAQSSRTAGAKVTAFIMRSLDGTNYEDLDENTCDILAVWPLPTGTSARRVTRVCEIGAPTKFKVFVRNESTQAFGASTGFNYGLH